MDLKVMQQGVEMLLRGMDVDLADPNFSGTPERVARMYREMLTPQENTWATFPAKTNDMIILRGHRAWGICPHHLLPVELMCNVGYVPNRLACGLSKLARACEEPLTSPMLQEDLAHEIANSVNERLDPKGVAVVLYGRHNCMSSRGVRTDGDIITSVMRGVFLLVPTAREEFLSLIRRGN
jgi:GTP cyclohydrolase I